MGTKCSKKMKLKLSWPPHQHVWDTDDDKNNIIYLDCILITQLEPAYIPSSMFRTYYNREGWLRGGSVYDAGN